MKYLKRVEVTTDLTELLPVSRLWDPFDTELAAGIQRIAKGAVKRELTLLQESMQRECRPLSGRACLWVFLNRYHVDRGQALQADYANLFARSIDQAHAFFSDKFIDARSFPLGRN